MLYAAGNFTMAGGVAANYIAQWDGSNWSAVGSGVGGTVYALAVSGSMLYAGGNFTMAGGVAANYIAQWDGNNWSAVGTGMSGYVNALAVSGTNLYAGGHFFTAGGVTVQSVAQWNGSSWSALGSGITGGVEALAVSGSSLYAACQVTPPAWFHGVLYGVVKWDGSSWSTLGLGMDKPVITLAVSGSTLYAGGFFTDILVTNIAYASANRVAQWDGSSWSALGSGINGTAVYALAVSGSSLYAGGIFTTAGSSASPYIAKATIGAPTILSQPQSTNVMAGSNAGFNVGADGPPLAYQWFKNGTTLSDGGNVSGSLTDLLSLANVYVADPGGYLVVVSNNFGSVTSSVATLTVSNLPLMLPGGTGNQGFANNQFWLTLSGPAGSNAVLSASTNLIDWTLLSTNPLTFGSMTFTDVLSTNFPQRFYKAQLQ
jgi:hypothetical protein